MQVHDSPTIIISMSGTSPAYPNSMQQIESYARVRPNRRKRVTQQSKTLQLIVLPNIRFPECNREKQSRAEHGVGATKSNKCSDTYVLTMYAIQKSRISRKEASLAIKTPLQTRIGSQNNKDVRARAQARRLSTCDHEADERIVMHLFTELSAPSH